MWTTLEKDARENQVHKSEGEQHREDDRDAEELRLHLPCDDALGTQEKADGVPLGVHEIAPLHDDLVLFPRGKIDGHGAGLIHGAGGVIRHCPQRSDFDPVDPEP